MKKNGGMCEARSNRFRLVGGWLGLGLVWSWLLMPLTAAEFHVDLSKGLDTNAGTAAAPFQTIPRALEGIPAGSTVYLHPGNYPALEFKAKVGMAIVEGGLVTLKPALDVADPLQSVSIARVQIGSRAGVFAGPDSKGTYDVNLRVEKVRIPDGVFLYGGRHLQIVGCLVERIGPWTGSEENIEKVAVQLGGCSDVLIEECEVTNTGTGLFLSGSDVRALRNRIHDIRHDGIRIVSLKDSLVEGNEIFNLDDGVEDKDVTWSRHCDAIHIFIPGPGVPGSQNSRVTIRGNRMFNCESQGIQFNNYLRNKELWNEDITIENNVFGPTRANAVNIADPVDGIIFRHNTFVSFAESRTFRGEGRDIVCDNSTFRISPNCKRAQVYNNILTNAFEIPSGWFAGNNVITTAKLVGLPTRFDVVAPDVKLVKPDAFDGHLEAESPAVDVGTRLVAAPLLETDILGTKRDARPDAGAFEVPGRSPAAETPAPVVKEPVRVYADDFRDANLDEDPWLGGVGMRGLAWSAPEGQTPWKLRAVASGDGEFRAIFSAQGLKDETWMMAANCGEWADGKATVTVTNAYNQAGSGILLRGNEATEGYLVDWVKGRITLRKRGTDETIAETELAQSASILGPKDGRTMVVSIARGSGGVKITVTDEAGAELLEAVDKTSAFPKGRLALFNRSSNGSHRTDFDAVKLELAGR